MSQIVPMEIFDLGKPASFTKPLIGVRSEDVGGAFARDVWQRGLRFVGRELCRNGDDRDRDLQRAGRSRCGKQPRLDAFPHVRVPP